jgi:hypothetical protein
LITSLAEPGLTTWMEAVGTVKESLLYLRV